MIGTWRNALLELLMNWKSACQARALDLVFSAIILGFIVFVSPAHAEEQPRLQGKSLVPEFTMRQLAIQPGHAEILRYTLKPGIVIIGDDAVVSASIALSNILVLTGLEAGTTNVIVLDDGGTQIDGMRLRVVKSGNTVVERRGIERTVVHCNPLCAPSTSPNFISSESAFSRPSDGSDAASISNTITSPGL